MKKDYAAAGTSQIDPKNITHYYRSRVELELFFIFAIFVANKPSDITAKKVNAMFLPRTDNPINIAVYQRTTDLRGEPRTGYPEALVRDEGIHSPFEFIEILVQLQLVTEWLEYWKVGQYKRLTRTIIEIDQMFNRDDLVDLDGPSNPRAFEQLHGVGRKTSRFFLIHSQQDAMYGVLDTHVLKWLKRVYRTTAISTPSSYKDYKLLEGLFLGECMKWQKTCADMDSMIWNSYHNLEA
jgi:hypothetical protein